MKTSQKEIEILPVDAKANFAYIEEFLTDKDGLLRAILANTGGIIVDHWIRLYGSGKLNFIERNNMIPIDEVVFAEDILGGLFLLLPHGNIGYFAPDCLEIEDLELTMGQFLTWCFHGDTDRFYVDYRWHDWKKEVAGLHYDNGIAFYPFLFAEANDLESRMRKEVPMAEIVGIAFEMLKYT